MLKLSPRSRSLVKLTLWAGVLTWLVFYLASGVVMAQRLANLGSDIFGGGIRGDILHWVAPIWVVFTVLLTVVLVSRYVTKKLGRR